MRRSVISVVGWGLDPAFYRDLKSYSDFEIYLLSHRDRDQIPNEIVSLLGEDRILCRPNLGYDWGAHQQFYETGIWKQYEHTVFMHDDIEIRDGAGLWKRCFEQLEKHAVVGNVEKGVRPAHWHPVDFGIAEEIPESREFSFGCVRGSFFMTTREALEKLGGFEVFWDFLGLDIRLGNWSLVASCARWQKRLGGEAISGVAQGWEVPEYPSTPYLHEFRRGGSGVVIKSLAKPRLEDEDRLALMKAIRDTSEKGVLDYWKSGKKPDVLRAVRDCGSCCWWKVIRGIWTVPGLALKTRWRATKTAWSRAHG